MLSKFLFKKIDNGSLTVFRIFFGILISLECYGAILTGWVKDTLIDPKFTFSFIGFEWLQPLPGNGMYVYFFIMGSLGVAIALGYKYRISSICFSVLWTGVYLMQKTSYNNHYYLLVLISFIMIFLPANRGHALDSKLNPELQSDSMYSYVKWIIVLQLFIVYTYASVAKLYGDWLNFEVLKLFMKGKADYYIIGDLLQQSWLHKTMGFVGILFDLLVIPAMLWKPTRKFTFIIAVTFHLFNAIVFQIGIFPFLALAFMVFFFEPKTIKKVFLKKKKIYNANTFNIPSYKNIVLVGCSIYFLIQLLLPIRHHFIKDDVLWTEEGHRLSWRMMLRSRHGRIKLKTVNKETGIANNVDVSDYLSKKQALRIGAYPDFIWQFAQYLKKEAQEKGENIAVYATLSKVSINAKPYVDFIDKSIDLANEKWNPYQHHEWILPSKKNTPSHKK